jgi:hypothetical protein
MMKSILINSKNWGIKMTELQAEKKINRGILIIKANAMSIVRHVMESTVGPLYGDETADGSRTCDIDSIIWRMDEDIRKVKAKYRKRIAPKMSEVINEYSM